MGKAIRLSGLIILLAALVLPAGLRAQAMRPHSILVLDQSDRRGPFYFQLFAALRAEVSAHAHSPTTLYSESLDLSRFGGAAYEEGLRQFLETKYRDRPIGVIVTVGTAALELVLRWRSGLWPDTPVVFGLVEETEFARLRPPSFVTGGITATKFADAVKAARAVVPNLKSVVLVAEDWKRQLVFNNWKEEVEAGVTGVDVIEIIGRPINEVLERVSTLPEDSAIVYSGLYTAGAPGNFQPPAETLRLVAAKANRPIVVASETFIESGGIGGFVLVPATIGADAARRALRILDGEAPESIPPSVIDAVKPVFNWQQMQRWKVNESGLPAGSRI